MTFLWTTLVLLTSSSGTFPAVSAAVENRIVGGTNVRDAFKYPYFVQLAEFNCGAAVIHDDYLLTAAHVSERERLANRFCD